jgi:uroporphyrinogen-III synthase
LVLVLALVVAAPYWAPPLLAVLPWGRGAAQAAQTEAQLRDVSARLAAIQQQLDQLPQLSNRVAALENRPQPDAAAAVAPLAGDVQRLAGRLDQIDTELGQLAHAEAANAQSPERVLMIALAGLGNAVSSSRPFAAELASVEALAQKRSGWASALQPLEGAAKTGLPSIAVLARRFADEVAPAILRADATAPNPQQSVGQAVLARLRSLVVIRRVDGGAERGSTAERAVAEAQAALDKGDLDGAVTALGTLQGGAATAAQPWLKAAQERLDAEHTIAKLGAELAGDMAAGPSGG